MRSISGTLLAAQKGASRQPYVRVEVWDMLAGVVRPTFTRLYAGDEEDFHHAATMPADGSLVRARVVSWNGSVEAQRTVNPGPGSSFSNWAALDTAGTGCNIAMCSRGASVLLFFVDPLDGHTIYLRESGDSGATWGSRQTVMIAPVNLVQWMAASFSDTGVPALFFASDEPLVYVTKRSGSQWSSATWWPNSVSQVTGLSCAYQGDWLLSLTGRNASGDYRVWTCIYGDGGSQAADTWSPLQEASRAKGDSGVEFHCPFQCHPDVARLSLVEKYTGSSSYTRPHLLHTLAGTSYGQCDWREPIPFDLAASHGLAQAEGGGDLWLAVPFGVWRGSLSQASADVSGDVVSLRVREGPDGGEATVTLRNDDGRYNDIGSGAYAAIRQGSEVRISPGYSTGAGQEVSEGPAFWVAGWEYVSQPGGSLFVLHCADPWWLLSGWRARRQFTWAAGEESVLDILAFVLGRAGLTLTAPNPSTTIATLQPEFTIHPGESGSTAARRLLALAPDRLYFRGQEARLRFPQAGDATDYAIGADHPLHQGRYGQSSLNSTRVQVYGGAGMAEAFGWSEMPLLGERLLQRHDLNQDTQQKVQQRADDLVRDLQLGAAFGEVVAPPSCGQELYDVLEITDARAGLDAAKHRVTALELEYRRDERPRYLQRIALGGV